MCPQTVLKEKALNTTALLQQHQDLQSERQRLQASLEGAQAACQAAEAGKREAQDGMAVMKKQLASAQAEAGKASAQAAAAQRSIDKAVKTLGSEMGALRRMIEERATRPPIADATASAEPTAAPDGAEASQVSALQSSVSEAQQQLARLAQQVAVLEAAREARQAAEAGAADAPAVRSLQQQVCRLACSSPYMFHGMDHCKLNRRPCVLQLAVMRQDQQLMVGEMQRWKSFLGSFAALAGGSGRAAAGPAASEPASELASGWQPVSPAELMMEASNAPALRGTTEGESVQRSGVLDMQQAGGHVDRQVPYCLPHSVAGLGQLVLRLENVSARCEG